MKHIRDMLPTSGVGRRAEKRTAILMMR